MSSVSGRDSLLLFVISTPGVVFFNSDTFERRHQSSSVPPPRAERSPVTFFRMAALYKLEDLLLLKASCSKSTAADKLSELRNNVRKKVCTINLMRGVWSVKAYRNGSAALWWPYKASCSRLRQCSLA